MRLQAERPAAASTLPPPPELGQRVMRSIETGSTSGVERADEPRPGRVVYINSAHRYYTVCFDGLGFCQSYKY